MKDDEGKERRNEVRSPRVERRARRDLKCVEYDTRNEVRRPALKEERKGVRSLRITTCVTEFWVAAFVRTRALRAAMSNARVLTNADLRSNAATIGCCSDG